MKTHHIVEPSERTSQVLKDVRHFAQQHGLEGKEAIELLRAYGRDGETVEEALAQMYD